MALPAFRIDEANEYIKPIIDDVQIGVLSHFNCPPFSRAGEKSSTHEKRVLRAPRKMASEINGNMFQKNINGKTCVQYTWGQSCHHRLRSLKFQGPKSIQGCGFGLGFVSYQGFGFSYGFGSRGPSYQFRGTGVPKNNVIYSDTFIKRETKTLGNKARHYRRIINATCCNALQRDNKTPVGRSFCPRGGGVPELESRGWSRGTHEIS